MPTPHRLSCHPNNQLLTYNNLAALTLTVLPIVAGITLNGTRYLAPKALEKVGAVLLDFDYLSKGLLLTAATLARLYHEFHSDNRLQDVLREVHANDLMFGTLCSILGLAFNNVAGCFGLADGAQKICAALTTVTIVSLLVNTVSRSFVIPRCPETMNTLSNHKASLATLAMTALVLGFSTYNAAVGLKPVETSVGLAIGLATPLAARGMQPAVMWLFKGLADILCIEAKPTQLQRDRLNDPVSDNTRRLLEAATVVPSCATASVTLL